MKCASFQLRKLYNREHVKDAYFRATNSKKLGELNRIISLCLNCATQVQKLAKNEILMVNIGSLSTGGRVLAIKADLAKIVLTNPVCTEVGEKIALSRRVEKHWRYVYFFGLAKFSCIFLATLHNCAYFILVVKLPVVKNFRNYGFHLFVCSIIFFENHSVEFRFLNVGSFSIGVFFVSPPCYQIRLRRICCSLDSIYIESADCNFPVLLLIACTLVRGF